MSEINSAPVSSPSESSNDESNSPELSSNEPKIESKPAPPAKRKFKYKADNQDIEEELSDDEIANRLSLAKAASKRMQEAAATKKQTEQLLRALQENPLEVLNDDRIMGQKKFREIAENFLIEQLKLEQMSPEQRLQMERDRELQHYKEQEKLRQQEQEQQKMAGLEKQYIEKFEKTIIDALQSSGLPKNPKTVASMARLLQLSIKNGIEADSKILAQMVKDEYQTDLKSIIGDLEAEQLLAMFGDDIANKIRKHDLSKLQIRNPAPAKPAPRQDAPVSTRLSPREFSEQLRNKFNK